MALREYDFEKEPTVSVVKKILTDSIKMKATDIHFDPQTNDLSIKFRINGNLVEYTIAPDNVKTNIITRIKILSGMNITESILPQVGTINFEYESKTTNMRVSSLPVVNGEKLVVHISNYAKNLKSISRIGFNKEDVNKIKDLLKEQQGIILITGTTASGKTTTMYSLLKEINSKSTNIISIEDPIKMKIDGINQVQLAPEKGITYKTIIRNALLQDPNVICINELVDDETARSALRASVTGKLIISTMHTKSAYTTIDTLLNMDVENYLLGSNLIGIISQRLVKRLCPTCREKKKASDYEKTVIREIMGEEIDELYYPKGCEECQSGYTDQIPVVEVIKIDDELRSAISNNKNRELIRNIIYEENNSILKDGFKKAIEGETSFSEIIRITDVKIDFTEDEKYIKEFILGNGDKELKPQNKKSETKNENEEIKKEKDVTEELNNQEQKTSKNEIDNKDTSDDSKENIKEEKANKTDENNVPNINVEESNKAEETSNIKDEIDNEINKITKIIVENDKNTEESSSDNSNLDEKIVIPNIFPPLKEEKIEDSVITAEKTDDEVQKIEIPIMIKEKDIKTPEEIKNIEETKDNVKEQIENEQEKASSITPINLDDDDDEDDFNYGDSYSIF